MCTLCMCKDEDGSKELNLYETKIASLGLGIKR